MIGDGTSTAGAVRHTTAAPRAGAVRHTPGGARATAAAAALALLAAALGVPRASWAAGYPRYGGNLRIATPGPAPSADATLADSPADVALRSLEVAPACRLGEHGRVEPLLALAWEEDEDSPALKITFATPELAQAQAAAWAPQPAGGASPYAALLYPLRQVLVSGNKVSVRASFRWPDLAATLCHPALAARRVRFAGAGPYLAKGGDGFVAQPIFAGARPYPDRMEWHTGNERAAQRLFALGDAEVLVGAAGEAPIPANAPQLFATYLLFRPRAVGPDFRPAIESAVDRADLTRYFVHPPAAPLPALLPPSLLAGEANVGAAPPPPAPLTVPRPVEILFDETLPDQRAVAERLQVRLHDLGYRLSLRALPRALLRQRWMKGDYQLLLQSVLLPPEPAPAFALVLDLAGRRDLLPLELPALGMLEEGPRQERVRARVAFFTPTLSVVPLYVQGLSLNLAPSVRGLTWDGNGLPRLDALWLSP